MEIVKFSLSSAPHSVKQTVSLANDPQSFVGVVPSIGRLPTYAGDGVIPDFAIHTLWYGSAPELYVDVLAGDWISQTLCIQRDWCAVQVGTVATSKFEYSWSKIRMRADDASSVTGRYTGSTHNQRNMQVTLVRGFFSWWPG